MTDETRHSPAETVSHQGRERSTGRFAFDGNWGRKCTCGHELGVHSAEAPHECMNVDRFHIGTRNDPWADQSLEAVECVCTRFRPSKSKQLTAYQRPEGK